MQQQGWILETQWEGDEADQGSLQAGSHLYKAQKETGFCWGVNMCLYPGYLSDGRGPAVMW